LFLSYGPDQTSEDIKAMDERRSSKRWRTVLKARILFNNRASVLDCTVRDLSEAGARIYFADTAALPATFELEIPNKGLRIEGRVMWSRGANHGVMFRQKVKVWTEAPRAAVA
jgi:hypothetical protein